MEATPRGFTLIEIMIVFGVIAAVAGAGLVVSLDLYRSSSFRSDTMELVSALQHARMLSMDDACECGMCTGGVPHGVEITRSAYVIFQGDEYTTRDSGCDETISSDSALARMGLAEVVFAPSSGDVQLPGVIVLSDGSGHSSTTTIGSEGQILWSD